MLTISESYIHKLSIHQLLAQDQLGLKLSSSETVLAYESLSNILKHYSLQSFVNKPDYYRLNFSNDDPSLNPLHIMCSHYWDGKQAFHDFTISVAKHLHQCSQHPNINPGDLMVLDIKEIGFGDEMVNGICILKSEIKDSFLQVMSQSGEFSIQHEEGIPTDKLDKGCLILNTEGPDGYRVLMIDRLNGSREAQYWRDNFLKITPLEDAYHLTARYMNMAQSYLAHQVNEEFEVERADQLHMIRRTADYFKENESFNESRYENEVLSSPELIDSFRSYKKQYTSELELPLGDEFSISKAAVKKSAKDFKSILKLDKNFHVYIHGDRELIQRGTDPDGRKYYKLYFETES